MKYIKTFVDELNNAETRYFILDTNGGDKHGDIDFVKYEWSRNRFNKVREGDICLFRRPGTTSESKSFYFFGAAEIGKISDIETRNNETRVSAELIKVYPFPEYLHKDDPQLDVFQWEEKERGKTWANFFNQYGMNQITRNDFIGILKIIDGSDEDFDADSAKSTIQDIQNKNYYADDGDRLSKYRAKQSAISNKVKAYYKNQCAICKLSTKAFLIGSHIVPWSHDKYIRLDPSNVICLCSLHDRAFDAGYITIDSHYRVIVSNEASTDPVLYENLKPYAGRRIHLPADIIAKPNQQHLEYHRNKIYERFLEKSK